MARTFAFSLRSITSLMTLWYALSVQAIPEPQDNPQPAPEDTIAPITSITTIDGTEVTAVFTPTSFSISGLSPPITAATTVTSIIRNVHNNELTIAVAVAAGAGIVGGSEALAVWLFDPAEIVPPAPTEPPAYPTEPQDEPPEVTDEPPEETATTTSSEPAACPFPTDGPKYNFAPVEEQPEFEGSIPWQDPILLPHECNMNTEGGHAERGTYPDYVEELIKAFCHQDQSQDFSRTLGKDDLPNDSTWKHDDGPVETVKFDFKFNEGFSGCSTHCTKPFLELLSSCKYNSHSIYGSGFIEQGCGTYSFEIGGPARTHLECTENEDPTFEIYMRRDALFDVIEQFCNDHDGDEVEADESTWIRDDRKIVRASFTDSCEGKSSYTIEKDTCIKYLTSALDDCNKGIYEKYGGTITDEDNCGVFRLQPQDVDRVMCWPENARLGYTTDWNHADMTEDVAQSAIDDFCGSDRYIDPDNKRDNSEFYSSICDEPGYGACDYWYNSDGERVDHTEAAMRVSISVRFQNPNDELECSPEKYYDLSGDRCQRMLAKVVGKGPGGICGPDDDGKLGGGSIVENGDKGCVIWDLTTLSINR